ncbi:MAG TPA: hypothetical protein PLE30_01350 [Candidatus Kapabacteria bacterium]|nr:hypothetical protein [Candidatus Kapabacteria bacterium]
MKFSKLFIIIIVFFYSVSLIFCQSTNYQVIDSLISLKIKELNSNITNNIGSCYIIKSNFAEISTIIETKLLEEYPKTQFYKDSENNCSTLNFNTKNIFIKYVKIDEELVERIITIDLAINLEESHKPLKLLQNKITSYKDTVFTQQILSLQKSPYAFDKAEIPQEEYSFYENILQPVVFIGTAIITIAILFTARSN